VASIGGFVRQYQIDVDPNRLAAYGLTIRDVVEAVQMSNNNVGGKVLEKGGIEYIVRGLGLIHDVEDVERIVVTARGGTPVYISNLGAVTLGPEFRRGALEKDGREVVGGVVTMRYGESAPEILRRVKQKLAELSKGLPPGVAIVPFYDRSALIARAVGTLKRALVEEILLVTLAHVLFLLHFRSILIVTLPLPISILISTLIAFIIQFILFLGFTLYFWLKGAAIQPNIWVLFTPVLLVMMAGLGLGCGIIVSSLTTRYRDLRFLVAFGVQLWMFATPIIYPVSSIPEQYQMLIKANPITPIVETFRYAFLGAGTVSIPNLLYSAGFMLVVLTIGILLFNRIEATFMDSI
jgi:ABC-type polysaccharide/polyol phosphate export permease